jgi:hypothetical protein
LGTEGYSYDFYFRGTKYGLRAEEELLFRAYDAWIEETLEALTPCWEAAEVEVK